MKNKIKTDKTETPRKTSRVAKSISFILNGEFLTRDGFLANMPYILFLAVMLISYIAWGYQSERTIIEIKHSKKILEERKAEFTTIKSQLETKMRQSTVSRDIEEMGLNEPSVPPITVLIPKNYLQE